MLVASAMASSEAAEVRSKSKVKKANDGSNLEAIQAEVASFAAQLGLASGEGFGAGFDDSDFRKTGRIGDKKKKSKTGVHADGNVEGKKVEKSPGGEGKKGEKSKKAGKLEDLDGKGKERKRKENGGGQDIGLSFGSGKKLAAIVEKGKGKKRSLPSDPGGQGEEKSAKKERLSEGLKTGKEGNSKNDAPAASKKVVSLDRSLAKSLQSASLWYEGVAAAAADPKAKSPPDMSAGGKPAEGDEFFASKRKEAEQLMDKAVSDYERSRSKDSDTRWLMTARRSGTSSDKVAAMTVMLQDKPMLNLRTLDALLGMVTSKGGKRHAAVGIDALRELFLRSLLPDRKLKYLNQQPLSSLVDSKEGSTLLLYWYWEDCLKRRYERFVISLEEATKDTLPFLKEKALKTVFELLKTKPEQERRLLSALVNKLGDPERKIASNASYLLSCLLTAHPVMKTVVVEEVDSFLFRPHVGMRARYYAAVFLNQIMLTSRGDGPKVAKQLINLYFALFRTVTLGETKEGPNQKGKKRASKHDKSKRKFRGAKGKHDGDVLVSAEVDIRLLSALLTGVNRAFPYVAADDINSVIEEHTPVLFRLVHSDNFNVAVQALMLLHQLLLKNQAVSERFYRALYAVLLSPSLTKSSKAEMFLNLLFKALKEDIDLRRMAAFAKRLTQVALQQPPQFACGCLLLLSEVLKARPSLWDGILQPESRDDEIEHFVDVPDEDSADKALDITPEPNSETNGASEDISGSDFDAEEHMVDRFFPGLVDEGDDSSSDEEGDTNRTVQKASKGAIETKSKTSVVGSQPLAGATLPNASEEPVQKTWPVEGYYDPRHREPSYCNADKACWWELTALARHMHPSVASMARTLLSGANVVYAGDPLRDLVLGAFLDRFAEKKPKQKGGGSMHTSAMAGTDKTVVKRLVGEELLALDENEVAPDDVVFHKFYQTKVSKRKVKKAKERNNDEDDDITGLDGVDGDDSDEDEVDALLERDEGREMGSAGEEDDSEGEDSEGEFDYDKLEHTFDMEDEEDEEMENPDPSPKKQQQQKKKQEKKGRLVEPAGSDSEEWNGSESDFDLGEYPESEAEDDSDGSIDVGDAPSDEESKPNQNRPESFAEKGVKKRKASGESKAKKTKRKQVDVVEVPSGKREKSKSPFASFQEYANIIDRDEEGHAPKGKGRKAKGKKFQVH